MYKGSPSTLPSIGVPSQRICDRNESKTAEATQFGL